MCVKSSRVEKLEIPCAKMFRSVQERIIDRNVEGDREGDRFIQKMIKLNIIINLRVMIECETISDD